MSVLPLSGIAIGQLDFTVGDVAGNAAHIRQARAAAAGMGAKLLVLPELAMCGYPPEDLVLKPMFVAACMEEAMRLAAETVDGGPALLLGCPWAQEGWTYNAALLLAEGKVQHIQPKRMLPNYGIFDEKRVFTPGEASRVVRFGDVILGVLVCEDMWYEHVARDLMRAGAQMLIAINASPFESGKLAHRHEVARAAVNAAGVPLLYVNMVGAQDDIVFDGGSFVMDEGGAVRHQADEFRPVLTRVEDIGQAEALEHEAAVWNALCAGLGDYVRKNGFSGVLLGLSGGIDSALTACIAVDTLGPDAVLGVLLPSPYTSPESNEDARLLARNLGIRAFDVPISGMMEAYAAALSPAMEAVAGNASWQQKLEVGGNLQARIRGASLMALSNASGRMLLNTGNKSEVAVGYTTLYGDSCGGYAVLKDVYKTQVYALAEWVNAQSPVIPQRSITREPTAELAPGQKDADQLPPYATLDAILLRLIEGRQEVAQVAAAGFDRAVVEKVARLVRINEYKRRQAPPGAKISPMLFGRDWRFPLTNGWKG